MNKIIQFSLGLMAFGCGLTLVVWIGIPTLLILWAIISSWF